MGHICLVSVFESWGQIVDDLPCRCVFRRIRTLHKEHHSLGAPWLSNLEKSKSSICRRGSSCSRTTFPDRAGHSTHQQAEGTAWGIDCIGCLPLSAGDETKIQIRM